MSKGKYSGRIGELNREHADVLQPYRKLTTSISGIISSSYGYFLSIGVALFIIDALGFTQQYGGSSVGVSSISFTSFVGVFALLLLVGLSAWTISIRRATLEKIANKRLTLKESSFIPDFDRGFFTRGIKYVLASTIMGVVMAVGVFVFIGVVLGIGGLLENSFTLMFLFFVFVLMLVFVLVLLISPFLLPLQSLYVYYGDTIGIKESVQISISLGKENYRKLLLAVVKMSLFNWAGLMLFGVGYIYTSVWGVLYEVNVVGEILNVSLKEGHTFNGKVEGYEYIGEEQEPIVEPREPEVGESVDRVVGVGVVIDEEFIEPIDETTPEDTSDGAVVVNGEPVLEDDSEEPNKESKE